MSIDTSFHYHNTQYTFNSVMYVVTVCTIEIWFSKAACTNGYNTNGNKGYFENIYIPTSYIFAMNTNIFFFTTFGQITLLWLILKKWHVFCEGLNTNGALMQSSRLTFQNRLDIDYVIGGVGPLTQSTIWLSCQMYAPRIGVDGGNSAAYTVDWAPRSMVSGPLWLVMSVST